MSLEVYVVEIICYAAVLEGGTVTRRFGQWENRPHERVSAAIVGAGWPSWEHS